MSVSLYFKCLSEGYGSIHKFAGRDGSPWWEAPTYKGSIWQPGAWKENGKPGLACHYEGLHLVPEYMLIHWWQYRVCVATPHPDSAVAYAQDCIVTHKARLEAEVYLPNAQAYALSVEIANLAFSLFKELIQKEDIQKRLGTLLETFQKDGCVPENTEKFALEVLSFLEEQQRVGFELNDMVHAARCCADSICTILALKHGESEAMLNYNGCVLRKQLSFLMEAAASYIRAKIMAYGSYDTAVLEPYICKQMQPFLQLHLQYPLLEHSVRYNVSQYYNSKVLGLLRYRYSNQSFL